MLISCLGCGIFNSVQVQAQIMRKPVVKAWPGRPGGNGDGSEEWLKGNYGETNGAFRLVGSCSGIVSDLVSRERASRSIRFAIVGLLGGNCLPGTSKLVKLGYVTVLIIAEAVSGEYEGNDFRSETYISGRCMKTIIKTYEYKNYTEHKKTYVKWTKW